MLPYPFILIFAVLGVALLMRPRRFYFVRHGETILNAEHIRQGEEGGLSENGRQQAEHVGRYLKRFPVKYIISSSFPRARETATIINKHLHVPVTYSALFGERRNPTEVVGKHIDDPEVVRIIDKIDLSYHDDSYRYSDEENFADLKKRAREALASLSRPGVRKTIVVTHHVFLKILIAYLLYREHLHAADFAKLAFFNYSDNAGVTVCEFHPWRVFSKTRGWEVVSFNEKPS